MELYSIDLYEKANKKFIDNKGTKFNNINDLITEVNKDKKYHMRMHINTNYIFFGELDNYEFPITNFIDNLKLYMKNTYGLEFDNTEFKYTQNNKKLNSYHYSIPKWYCSIEKMKLFHNKIKIHITDCIDTTIYAEHWFRCPNQSKSIKNSEGIHVIINGIMQDFIVFIIPDYSINIENINEIYLINNIVKKDINTVQIIENTKNSRNNEIIEQFNNSDKNNKNSLCNQITKSEMCIELFDNCYKQDRFDKYSSWINVGMAIKNTFDENEGENLFDYYSSKSNKYEGREKTINKYNTFVHKQSGITIATIYYYAIEDNKPKFIEIISRSEFDLEATDICKYLKIIGGNQFIYIKNNNIYELYCYNGKYWEKDDVIMRNYISTELYNFLKTILNEVYYHSNKFTQSKKKLDKLKNISYKKDIIETYKEYGYNKNIKFDDKWWLFGFDNIVYDMKLGKFRDYEYDDYVSITCDYDWKEPTLQEIETIKNLIINIMPIEEERNAYLQILSTCIDGRALENFIIFNGKGGNGKGMMNDLLLTMLGKYGMIGNNAILFERSHTGCNPEKANINKKRCVIFREPAEKNRFENSVIKELTGGGTISARGLYDNSPDKKLNLTLIVECNKKPLFADDPTEAEKRRIIDIYFRSLFKMDDSEVDADKYIYKANPFYKEITFQNQHKYALFKILSDEHQKFIANGSILKMPSGIVAQSNTYMELSSDIIQWFKSNYEENMDSFIKLRTLHDEFLNSVQYNNMLPKEKIKYTYDYFKNYIINNSYFEKHYSGKFRGIRDVIKYWSLSKKDTDDL